jgi:hypothetical protein
MHVLPDVAAFFTHVCASLMESAAVAAWAGKEYPGVHTCFTGVSLGGSIAPVAALMVAAQNGPGGPGVATCPIVVRRRRLNR